MGVSDTVGPAAIVRILAVMAAGAVVAAGAAGVSLLLPPTSLRGAWPWVVRLGGLAAAAGALAILLRLRAKGGRRTKSDPTLGAISTAATIMSVLAVLALLAPRAPAPADADAERAGQQLAMPEPDADDSNPPETRPVEPRPNGAFPAKGEDDAPGGSGVGGAVQRAFAGGGSSPAEADWRFRVLLLGILLGLGALIGLLVLWRRSGRREDGQVADPPVSAEEAEAGLASSLEEVSYEGPDPRRQITAAYHRLLAALAEAGAPREPQEAPHEHLNRVLGPLGVRPGPMHRLAELYVIAQFSTRALTDGQRAGAAQALGEALADLRAHQAGPRARRRAA